MSQTFEPIKVRPTGPTFHLLVTAQTAVSHHDAAVTDNSNRQLFNRQKQIIAGSAAAAGMPTADELAAIAASHPAPAALEPLLAEMQTREVIATALVRLWLDVYNSQDGSGLFEGMERYSRLEDRLRQSAVASVSLRELWGRLADSLAVAIPASRHDGAILQILGLRAGMQQLVLETIRSDTRTITQIARHWHTVIKEERRAAEEDGREWAGVTLTLTAETAGAAGAQVIEVPALSGNSVRHQMVREPGWWHLAGALGLRACSPGKGDLPPGVEALFYNGGNLLAGAKAPSSAFTMAWEIRARYPLLDLLGGNLNAFDLGSSRLIISPWLVCAENAPHLAGTPAEDLPQLGLRAADMLDDVTQTRQSGRIGLGQMLRDFETLAAGTTWLVKLRLDPTTPRLTAGALIAAVETYRDDSPRVGGQGARGFGLVDVDWIGDFPDDLGRAREDYEAYLEAEAADLREGLVSGALGTKEMLLS